MKPTSTQANVIENVNFQIELKGFATLIVDTKQRKGLRESTVQSLSKFGFTIQRIPDANFKVFKISN
jgi:hypothetical protein